MMETNASRNFIAIPAPLQALHQACRMVYPNQTNPLQVSALVKYWLGGPDPLDYISMFSNDGVPELNVPPHWHYISFGLSDLHGDGRVHKFMGPGLPSGFGFELTFRLKKSPEETAPPTWPANLLQSLAKYVFKSGNTLAVGDHISWHCGLDGKESTKIHHLLVDRDPQLASVETVSGIVDFVQIVGVFLEELEAAQRWNGVGVLNILKTRPESGGQWLVTDMTRTRNIIEMCDSVKAAIETGIINEGSNLTGVNSACVWSDRFIPRTDIPNYVFNREEFMMTYCQLIKSSVEMDLNVNQWQSFSSGDDIDDTQSTECPLRVLDRLHIVLNKEAGYLLPLVVSGRLKHGRHFTFKSVNHNVAITFVAPNVTGTSKYVSASQPYAVYGSWVQIYIPEDFILELDAAVSIFDEKNQISLPKSFYWPYRRLAISVISENDPMVIEEDN